MPPTGSPIPYSNGPAVEQIVKIRETLLMMASLTDRNLTLAMRALVERKGAGLLYGTNYSVGVQVMLKLAQQMGASLAAAGYTFSIVETHHVSKLDKPSGTAISIAEMVERGAGKKIDVPIVSEREGDAKGLHVLEASSEADRVVLTHEAFSRRGFAEGAVRAAEWLATRTGCYDFRDVWEKL